MLTHGAMWGCGLTSLVVCSNDKFRDIRERNVPIRCEIWTTNIRSLGFRDVREFVTLWRLILRSLRCTLWRNQDQVANGNCGGGRSSRSPISFWLLWVTPFIIHQPNLKPKDTPKDDSVPMHGRCCNQGLKRRIRGALHPLHTNWPTNLFVLYAND